MGVVALAASRLRQTGKRRAAIGLTVAVFVFVAGITAAVLGLDSGKRRVEPLTQSEKAALVAVDDGGQRRLRHPELGFSILNPGPGLRASAEVVAAAAGAGRDPETVTYGFIDGDLRSTLVIAVMKNMGGSRAALSEHLDGLQRGLAQAVPAGSDVRWLDKQITWDDRRHVARVSAQVAGAAHVDVAAYAIAPPGRPPFIVDLMTASPDADHFPGLLDSFRP
jgi:hypothetical protein